MKEEHCCDQRLILTKDANELLDLSSKLKQSFKKDNIGEMPLIIN